MDASFTADVVKALAPGFVAGFAVQQGTEVFSSLLALLVPTWDTNVKLKKAILSLVAVALSCFIVYNAQLDVLQGFNDSGHCPSPFWHGFVTVIFISAGTEGFNSLLKWMSYKKEQTKASAAEKKNALPNGDNSALKKMPS